MENGDVAIEDQSCFKLDQIPSGWRTEVYHQWKNAYFEDAWPVLIIFQV